jgi:hypothetical protein
MDDSTEPRKIDYSRAPAFEVLFHLGKMTMRPGGMELTRRMLEELEIDERDKVVELAPGRGATTRMVLGLQPQSYTAVERDRSSQQNVQGILCNGELGQCVVGTAQATGLADGCASVVFGEAMLTMQTRATKRKIAEEAFRLLAPGGRYGIHETCLKDNVSANVKTEIESALRDALRVGARPLTVNEWRELLEEAGFSVRKTHEAPMLLLEPRRMIHDEGLWGGIRFVSRAIASPSARRRIWGIRQTFKRYSDYLNAAAHIAVKPA